MSSRFHVRYLSIPAAAALVVALAVGCSSEAPTALDQDQLELAAKKGKPTGSANRDDINASCDAYVGLVLTEVHAGSSVDDNNNGLICKKTN